MVGDRIQNKILAALPGNEYDSIHRFLELEDWPSGKPLYTSGQKMSYVYFVNTGMASLVSLTDEKLTTDKPESVQFNERLMHLMLQQHKSAARFFDDRPNAYLDYEDYEY